MLFRDFRTGLAVGLTALLFSSGAGAGTIGGKPGDDMDPDTTNDYARVSSLRATTIATEIFGGSANDNRGLELTHQKDIWLMLGRPTRYEVQIDVNISGASFADVQYQGVAKQMGVFALNRYAAPVGADPAALGADPVPLFAGTGGITSGTLTLAQGEAIQLSHLVRNGELVSTLSDFTGTLADADGNAVAVGTSEGNVQIMTAADLSAGLVPFTSDASAAAAVHTAEETACAMAFPRNDTTIRLRNCGEDGGAAVRAYHILGVTETAGFEMDGAQGLATPGSTVTVSASVMDASDTDDVVDTAEPVVLYRSANTVMTAVESGGRIGIDPFTDPPFTAVAQRGAPPETKATLGTVTGTTNRTHDGSGSRVAAEDLIEDVTLVVTHGVVTDDAFRNLTLSGISSSARGVTVEDDMVTYTVDSDTYTGIGADGVATGGSAARGTYSSAQHPIVVNFNGTDPISTWPAGEASVSFTAPRTAAANDYALPEGGSGALASFTRGGLSTEINMAQSSYGDGGTRYQSWVRIANNGASDGPVSVTLHDAATGDFIGAWDSPMIPAGGSIQVPVSALEDNAGHTPTSAQQYNIRIEGGINGYVQHVMWNTVEGLFSDLSGFRAGGGLNTEP